MQSEPEQPRVLVVDDDPDTCDILSQLLRHLGYLPHCMTDSTEALPYLLHQNYQAVLLDLVMPGLSGFDLLRAVKADGDNRTPVVAVSAFYDLRYQAREHGFDAFVEKPLELAKLRPVLERILPAV